MGDLIIFTKKGGGAVHSLKVQWWSDCLPSSDIGIRVPDRELASIFSDVLTSSSALRGLRDLTNCITNTWAARQSWGVLGRIQTASERYVFGRLDILSSFARIAFQQIADDGQPVPGFATLPLNREPRMLSIRPCPDQPHWLQ